MADNGVMTGLGRVRGSAVSPRRTQRWLSGIAIRMAENPKRPVVPVTVRHQPIPKEIVQRQYGVLRERFKTEMERHWAWMNLLAPIGAALIGEESHASA